MIAAVDPVVVTVIAVTLLVVLAAAVVALRCAEVSREVDVVLRNTPPTDSEEVGE